MASTLCVDKRWAEGLKLFNKKEYFECHDVIETLWLRTPKGDRHRDLYKGVIQAAAAIYQWDRGVHSGAEGLYKSSLNYLKDYGPRALGLDVSAMIREMKKCFGDFPEKRELTPHLEFNSKRFTITPHEHSRKLGKST